MKQFLLGCAAAVFGAGAAFAADLPARAPAQIYSPASAYSWSGFYIGAHGGYGWGENKFRDLSITLSEGKFEPAGGFGGVQVGYNSHFAPHWLIGGEFDFAAGDLSDSGSFLGASGSYKIDYFGTARTRFGYVLDRHLLYATGGVAWMHDKTRLSGGGALTSTNQYSVGWVIGGGWEYAIDNHWSAKIEYLYADFDKTTDIAGTAAPRTFDGSISTVKAGVNYRFGDTRAAAVMPVKAAPRAIWSGSYLGVHGGYGWGNYRVEDSFSPPNLIRDVSPDGGFGGFQSGANWMMSPNWLFGLETDASYGSLKDSGASRPGGTPFSAKIDAMGTLRARLGYVVDNSLFYVTGGGAYAHGKAAMSGWATTEENHFGWVLGGGVEYKFAPEWSTKLEYLYTDFGKNSFDGLGASRSTELSVNAVRVGINYSGPVIERLFGGK